MKGRPRTATTVASRRRRGLGKGEGEGYRPWFTRSMVASRGETTSGPLFGGGRHYLTLSRAERNVGLLLAWDQKVTDIREQFPLLPVEATQELATARGIRHPMQGLIPRERTLDFLVTHSEFGTVGLSIKPEEQMAQRRIRELLELEHDFAAREGWLWAVVTEREIPAIRALNLGRLNENWLIDEEIAPADRLEEDSAWLMARLLRRRNSVLETCRRFDLEFGRQRGSGIAICWHQLARQRWRTDLDQVLDPGTMRLLPSPPSPERWLATLDLR